MSTDDTEPTPEAEVDPAAESASTGEEARDESQAPEQDSPPESASDEPPAAEQPSEPVAAEETPTPAAEEAAAESSEETPTPEAEEEAAESSEETPTPEAAEEAAGASDEAPRAESVPTGEAAESAPGASADDAAASATEEQSEDEDYEPAPRQKPEIPGADLEPVFIPQEEQYLDAEAQAAAEAEAEAAAERARAEAEEEQARPIADAAIDLAAGARYTATGKRKTAVARVILKPGGGQYLINGRTLDAMFPRETLQRMIRQPLETVGYEARMDVIARMHGGGVSSQAGALRHGIARALIVADPNLRGELKRRGYLTRDPRVKERKKAGLKKARKRPQFSKR